MKSRNSQLQLLQSQTKGYGGELMKTRKGRAHGRPLDTRHSMHLVLRSSKAKGSWSFKTTKNQEKIKLIISKFSNKYGIRILSLANVGNHLHFHIKLSTRFAYKPFIRAVTSSIAMAVSGFNRWSRDSDKLDQIESLRFWDYRPYTRVVLGYRALLCLSDYIQLNQFEGFGVSRPEAKFIMSSPKFASWHNTG
ncbi:MAG: transposase [Oligoflexia bacterium]|nr:transposase [Oligoflexia bacterium]